MKCVIRAVNQELRKRAIFSVALRLRYRAKAKAQTFLMNDLVVAHSFLTTNTSVKEGLTAKISLRTLLKSAWLCDNEK